VEWIELRTRPAILTLFIGLLLIVIPATALGQDTTSDDSDQGFQVGDGYDLIETSRVPKRIYVEQTLSDCWDGYDLCLETIVPEAKPPVEVDCIKYPEVMIADCLFQDVLQANPVPAPEPWDEDYP